YVQPGGGGATITRLSSGGGGAVGQLVSGGGGDQNVETACSTADPPSHLTATLGPKSVILNWNGPGDKTCQVKTYNIWRSTNGGPFLPLANKVRGSTAPSTTFTDTNVKNNNTYSYFVTETNVEGATSGATNTTPPILVK